MSSRLFVGVFDKWSDIPMSGRRASECSATCAAELRHKWPDIPMSGLVPSAGMFGHAAEVTHE